MNGSAIPPGPPPGGPPLMRMGPPGPPPGGPPGHALGHQNGNATGTSQAYAPPMGVGMPNFSPPLPPGWSEHTAPDGSTKYYYNASTRESTYIRPIFSNPYPPQQSFPPAPPPVQAPAQPKKKKEKPKQKVQIPGTTWTRVTTNEGNVFYFEKESKKSEWVVPEEIKDQVAELEKEEKKIKEEEKALREEGERVERLERLKEAEEKKRKRIASEGEGSAVEVKKVKTEGGEDDEGLGPVDEEDEAAWMKAVAAEFAEADKATKETEEATAERKKEAEENAAREVFSVPDKVNVSLEEGRALFKALLIEKNISPFAPWDQSLPLFINDPRYVLLGSTKERQEVYEEYCRDVGRARRLNKSTTLATPQAGPSTKSDPEKEYKSFLRDEVTSTRTRFDDFRKKWKKDRRFYAFGRDDREREKMFKVHLRELGERKRADAERAEKDFMELLKDKEVDAEKSWADVKKGISGDARYDAVGSSSLREELFEAYKKKSGNRVDGEDEKARKERERKEKAAASLREREAKVREEKERVGKEMGKSRAGAGREEGERLFGSLLVDQIRDHEVTWQDALQYLSPDPRYQHPALTTMDKQRLFSDHIGRLGQKRAGALHSLFQAHTPTLSTPFDHVYSHVIDDPIVTRLNLTPDALEQRWLAWKRSRETEARQEFDQMLSENSFVEFWGGMRKKVVDEEASKLKEDEEREEGEGLGEGGAADLVGMAGKIDLEEIKSVLRRDKRYRQFDHIPDVREQWLRDYLANLEASSGSRTIHTVGFGQQ